MSSNRLNWQDSSSDQFSPSKAKLLVSSLRLDGSPFEKSVVLLMQNDQGGSWGVTLNKPANAQVVSAWEKLTGATVDRNDIVVAGGPLQGPVFALHQDQSLSDIEISGDLYLSAQIEKVQQLIRDYEEPYRIVVGVAGWQAGQLEQEFQDGLWYSIALESEAVFEDPDWMWELCIQEFGRSQIEKIIGNDIFPDHPELN